MRVNLRSICAAKLRAARHARRRRRRQACAHTHPERRCDLRSVARITSLQPRAPCVQPVRGEGVKANLARACSDRHPRAGISCSVSLCLQMHLHQHCRILSRYGKSQRGYPVDSHCSSMAVTKYSFHTNCLLIHTCTHTCRPYLPHGRCALRTAHARHLQSVNMGTRVRWGQLYGVERQLCPPRNSCARPCASSR